VKDLFSSSQIFERVPIPDADISILRDLDTHAPHDVILKKLLHDTKWQQREMNMYGRKVLQPRLTAWYGDPERTYIYSGIRNTPLPWSDLLRELKRRVEDCTDQEFNSVLLNYYRDNNDSMGFHSDDEKELGQDPAIASLSLGDMRTFLFKHKNGRGLGIIPVPLPSGSVLLMKGQTQRNYKHAINRESRPCGPRVNLTFRKIYTSKELEALRERTRRANRALIGPQIRAQFVETLERVAIAHTRSTPLVDRRLQRAPLRLILLVPADQISDIVAGAAVAPLGDAGLGPSLERVGKRDVHLCHVRHDTILRYSDKARHAEPPPLQPIP
jgi:alkylated DNA repair dioxygenase AlkB